MFFVCVLLPGTNLASISVAVLHNEIAMYNLQIDFTDFMAVRSQYVLLLGPNLAALLVAVLDSESEIHNLHIGATDFMAIAMLLKMKAVRFLSLHCFLQ